MFGGPFVGAVDGPKPFFLGAVEGVDGFGGILGGK